jgi:hypothetical protein
MTPDEKQRFMHNLQARRRGRSRLGRSRRSRGRHAGVLFEVIAGRSSARIVRCSDRCKARPDMAVMSHYLKVVRHFA